MSGGPHDARTAVSPADRVARAQAALRAHRQRMQAVTESPGVATGSPHPWAHAVGVRWQALKHKLGALLAIQQGEWGDAAGAGLAHAATRRPYLTVLTAALAGGLLLWAAPKLWRWWLLPLLFTEGRAWLNRHTVHTFSSWMNRTRERSEGDTRTPPPTAAAAPMH